MALKPKRDFNLCYVEVTASRVLFVAPKSLHQNLTMHPDNKDTTDGL